MITFIKVAKFAVKLLGILVTQIICESTQMIRRRISTI